MIDPDIWQDEKVGKLSLMGRIILLGIITIANDYGKLRGNAAYIRNQILPFDDVKLQEVEDLLCYIASLGIISLYQINGERFIKLTNWDKYQTLRHPSKDTIPDNNGNLTDNNGNLTAQDKLSKDKTSEVSTAGSDAKILLDFFFQCYFKRHNVKYIVKGAKDINLLKTLLKTLPRETIKTLINVFFQTNDKFTMQSDYSVGVFYSQVNKLQLNKPETSPYKELN